ncbi:uncharacterized protein [Chanodichthys erythropterus]|uniref:uncharacterized protein n=1 Tax=Chanodichthys erythropterus TaxID=933992 RepID=UPI00351F12BF
MLFVFIFSGLLVNDVVGVTDEIQSVSVMEGESVTLYCDVTEIQKADLILWTFGADSTRIAQINRSANKFSLYNDVLDGRFRDRLHLDKTGSLTITNITTEHVGLYKLQLIGGKEVPPKKFSIIVSAHLPVPVISTNCPLSSSSSCSLVCSAVNVSHVTLSWYKGNSLLSSISVSDLSISLSLPLEVEYQDKNTYSCVLNNPISNQTQHLDITHLCHTCAAPSWFTSHIMLVCVCVGCLLVVLAVISCSIHCYCKRKKRKEAVPLPSNYSLTDQSDGEEAISMGTFPQKNYTFTHRSYSEGSISVGTASPNNRSAISVGTGSQRNRSAISLGTGSQRSVTVDKDDFKTVSVKVGNSVTLNTEITEIQEDEVIEWRFANSKGNNRTEFAVIAEWNKTNNEEYLYNEEIFKDCLKLDHNTGSLTITNITPEHYGHYKLHIINEGHNISMILFTVGTRFSSCSSFDEMTDSLWY